MNKKTLLQLLFLFIFLQTGHTKPIDLQAAKSIAHAFFSKDISRKMKTELINTLQPAYVCIDENMTKTATQSTYYYVFNKGENSGFIIISADDRAKPVLGYSNTGSFTTDSLPPGFQYWLDFYKEELKYLFNSNELSSSAKPHYLQPIPSRSYPGTVSPLLKNIKYDQNIPYNNLCPLIPGKQERTASGCVATAMAQVMKYHQWPKQGKGSHSYTSKDLKIPLSANFSHTSYDWNHTLDTYPSPSGQNAEQINAIATLMLHCGISVDMNYNISSGASATQIAKALINNFDYDASMQLHYRAYSTTAQWADMLKEELSNNRPVIYNGQSSSEGHAFICDGYDANGLFHINWGWGGTSNGYFELSSLDPIEQGIGGSLGGYNREQNIITGIQPSQDGQTQGEYRMRLTTGLSVENNEVLQGETAIIRLGFRNLGVGSCYGYHGLGLYRPDDTFIKPVYQSLFGHEENGKIIQDTLNTGNGNDKMQWKLPINSSLPTGKYRIYPIYYFGEITGTNNWTIIPGEIGMPSYLNATIDESRIIFSTPDENRPSLTVTNLKANGKLYSNKIGRLEFNLRNTGIEYTGIMIIRIWEKENKDNYRIIGPEGISILNNETKTFEFSGKISFEPGEYVANVQYDSQDGYMRPIGDPIIVHIAEAPTEKPDISILNLRANPDAVKINGNNEIRFIAILKNTGGYAEAKAIANIYHQNGKLGTGMGGQFIFLDKNEEKEFTFKGFVQLEEGNYYTRIYIQPDHSDWAIVPPTETNKLTFYLANEDSGIENESQSQPTVYPNPATDFIHIECDRTVNNIRILNLSGQPVPTQMHPADNKLTVDVNNLAPGTYLLQIHTNESVITRKFVKK